MKGRLISIFKVSQPRAIIFTLVASYSRLTREWRRSLGANHILFKPKLPSHYNHPLSISAFLFSFSSPESARSIFTLFSECGNVSYSSTVLLFLRQSFGGYPRGCVWVCPPPWRSELWCSQNPQKSDLEGSSEKTVASL